MTFHTINSFQESFFNPAWELYNEAFPSHEKRFLEEQIKVLENDSYTFQVICDKDIFIGILGFWEIKNFIFIEHFAINSQLRGQNYGTRALNAFLKDKTQVILEIELPHTPPNLKRLEFYKKLGFVENEIKHFQVPFRKGDLPIELKLLSYKTTLEQDKYQSLYSYMKQILPV